MNWPPPIRVVGVGSPNGDDALAWEVIRSVQRRHDWGGEVTFHVVGGGQRLLDLLDGQGTLILIDALAPAGSPGAIQRFGWPDLRLERLRAGTTHDLRPAEALQFAETLKTLPACVEIFGIEAVSANPQSGLSPEVTAAVLELAKIIARELEASTLNAQP